VISFSAFSQPGEIKIVGTHGDKSYVSTLWSGLLAVPVTSVVKRVGITPPEISSSSLWDSLRAPMRVSTRLLSWFDIHFSFLFLIFSPDTLGLADQVQRSRYSSVVKSDPLGLFVRITLRIEGRLAPVTPSISFWVSGRAPLRISTRLLLFDMSFLLF
jgi:hypothetical protein